MRTKLGQFEDQYFDLWKMLHNVPDSPQAKYDMQGYFKDYVLGDKTDGASVNKVDRQVHFPDAYKMPGHPSFSIESDFYEEGMPARSWVGEMLIDLDRGKIVKNGILEMVKNRLGANVRR